LLPAGAEALAAGFTRRSDHLHGLKETRSISRNFIIPEPSGSFRVMPLADRNPADAAAFLDQAPLHPWSFQE